MDSRGACFVQVPPGIWAHRLFADSARFVTPSIRTIPAEMDERYRRIRGMPSTGDESAGKVLEGLERIYELIPKWLNGSAPPEVSSGLEVLARIKAIQRQREAGMLGASLDRMQARVPALIASAFSDGPQIVSAIQAAGKGVLDLTIAERLILDRIVASDERIRRRFVKRVYRTLDEGLSFNDLTDVRRVEPVLQWIREWLEREGRRDGHYVDVGCGMQVGAPCTLRAAELLREENLCSEIHGVDVFPPSPEFARRMAQEHRIKVYQADPARHALPVRYDVILLANVHRHLDRNGQERLLSHLGASLHPSGLLIVNWRFNDSTSPALCLRREGDRLVVTAEQNCVLFAEVGEPVKGAC